jgi:hypothetical protein
MTKIFVLWYSKKVRRGGVGSHFCIHNYFYERSPLWQQIREEEMRATDDAQPALQTPSSPDTSTNLMSTSMAFDPMDARHLSSLPLVRARVVKLLKGSRNCMHPCNNILLKLVCTLPNLSISASDDHLNRDFLSPQRQTDASSKLVFGS